MKWWLKIGLSVMGVVVVSILVVPLPLFDEPFSTVVEASDGTLLGARIADDGQWRFPPPDSLPEKYVIALLNYEDRWFYRHPGINPFSMCKAFVDNVKAGKIVRGGSTITMQVARMARGNRKRTYWNKFVEMLSALKLELFKSKKDILLMYAANAPFGGNTVGIEAAVWRYTQHNISSFSWAEAATLAVLPNSPASVNTDNNRQILKEKRDKLLETLYKNKYFDTLTLELSLSEPLLQPAAPMPQTASHLVDYFHKVRKGERIRTTIDSDLQQKALDIVNDHQKRLMHNRIVNAAALVVRVDDGAVLAYVGNSSLPDSTGNAARRVDIIRSVRSTGSILKPFLYAALLTSGDLLPDQLVADIPLRFERFHPQNADYSYSGAVKAGDALARSLNIPAVEMLKNYTCERFLDLLKSLGFTSFDRSADDYGLSLIIGGGEAELFELAGAYASMARSLDNYNKTGFYSRSDWHSPVFVKEKADSERIETPFPVLSASSIWFTYEALRRVNRPAAETGWQYFGSMPNLAWKTGTSYGSRDAWAVGTTDYAVTAVWAGNATGEGRPGLSGTGTAAPVMFDIVRLLPESGRFQKPETDMTVLKICDESGYKAGTNCTAVSEKYVPATGIKSPVCPYHKIIHLDKTETYRVNVECVDFDNIVSKSWFILPPAMEYYYKLLHPYYKTLPAFLPGCDDDKQEAVMEFIYPAQNSKVFFPKDFSGNKMSMLPEIVHRRHDAVIYWHLDNTYISKTQLIHQIEIQADKGKHKLTAIDDGGNSISVTFFVK